MEEDRAGIESMKRLYRERQGVEISDSVAAEAWSNLLGYFKTLLEWDRELKREEAEAAKTRQSSIQAEQDKGAKAKGRHSEVLPLASRST